MLSKEATSTIFWVFGMTRPGIEPRSPRPLAKGAQIVTVIIIGNKHGDPSSNLERSCLHFTQCKYFWEWYESNNSPCSYGWTVAQNGLFNFGMATNLGEGKLNSNLLSSTTDCVTSYLWWRYYVNTNLQLYVHTEYAWVQIKVITCKNDISNNL